jgi:hypothetical protein
MSWEGSEKSKENTGSLSKSRMGLGNGTWLLVMWSLVKGTTSYGDCDLVRLTSPVGSQLRSYEVRYPEPRNLPWTNVSFGEEWGWEEVTLSRIQVT